MILQPDQTYYVIDMVCWAGFSLYECTAEFRFFWLNSKLVEVGACDTPSSFHKYRFATVPVYNCDQEGLQTAYTGPVPCVKDGLLFYNKSAFLYLVSFFVSVYFLFLIISFLRCWIHV